MAHNTKVKLVEVSPEVHFKLREYARIEGAKIKHLANQAIVSFLKSNGVKIGKN